MQGGGNGRFLKIKPLFLFVSETTLEVEIVVMMLDN